MVHQQLVGTRYFFASKGFNHSGPIICVSGGGRYISSKSALIYPVHFAIWEKKVTVCISVTLRARSQRVLCCVGTSEAARRVPDGMWCTVGGWGSGDSSAEFSNESLQHLTVTECIDALGVPMKDNPTTQPTQWVLQGLRGIYVVAFEHGNDKVSGSTNIIGNQGVGEHIVQG